MNVENYVRDVLEVSGADLEHARARAQEQGTTVEQQLRDAGLISHAEYSQMLAHLSGITYVSLKNKHIAPEFLTKLAEPVCRTLRAVVFDAPDGTAHVAVESLTENTLDELSIHLKDFKVFLTDESSLSRVLGVYQSYLREHYGERIANHARRLQSFDSYEFHGETLPIRYVQELQDSFDAIKITELLLSVMQTMSARDIYIDRGSSNTEISMRFGSKILPTINLDVHIFDRLLWVYTKQADVDLTMLREPLHTAHLPTPEHKDLHARVTFVTTQGEISHIHINTEDSAQLFPTIESLLPSQRQSQALIHQLQSGPLMIASSYAFERKRVYYSLLENLSRHTKRVTSFEEHIEVNIPEVMQIARGRKENLHKLLTSAEILRSDVMAFSEQLKEQEMYRHITGRLNYAHVLSFEHVKNVVKVIQAFNYTRPVGLIVQHVFDLKDNIVMRPLHSQDKMTLSKLLEHSLHSIDLSGDFAHTLETLKKTKKSKREADSQARRANVTINGYVTVFPFDKPTMFENVQKSSKSAIVEHALMRSSQGEIVIQDIMNFIVS